MIYILFYFLLSIISEFDVNSVVEVESLTVYGSDNTAGTLGTGLLIANDKEFQYFIIPDYLVEDEIYLKWTNKSYDFTIEKPQDVIDLIVKAEVVYKDEDYNLAIIRSKITNSPMSVNLNLPEENKNYRLIGKNYIKENHINKYKILGEPKYIKTYKIGTDSVDIPIEYATFEYTGWPWGGGVIVNSDNEVVCFIQSVSVRDGKYLLRGPTGKTIINFLKLSQRKDDVPEAPNEN